MGLKTFFSDLWSIKSTPLLNPATFSGYAELFGTQVAGVNVNKATAIAHDTVYSCIRDKAQSLGQLPVILRRNGKKVESGREFNIFTMRINEFQTMQDFIEMYVTCLELSGNFYATADLNSNNSVMSVTPLLNQMVGVNKDFAGRIVYSYVTNDGKQITTYPNKHFIHIKQNSLNGYLGLSPLGCKRAIGIGMSQDTHLSNIMENGATPSGILETPNQFKNVDDATRLREQFDERYSGTRNSGKTVLLENGLTFKTLSISPADAELLEERRYNRQQICGIFGVPEHRIGGTSSSNKKDVEQENKDYYVNKLMPLGKKLEDAINAALPDSLSIQLDEKGFTRGDFSSLTNAAGDLLSKGLISINESREIVDYEPVDGGDVHAIDTNNLTFGLVSDISRLQEENRLLAQQGQQGQQEEEVTEDE